MLILLENLLRRAGSRDVSNDDVHALAAWPGPARDIAFMPGRADAGLHRRPRGGRPRRDAERRRARGRRADGDRAFDPRRPRDRSPVQVDLFRSPEAYERNIDFEYRRNAERYSLLRWAQAFNGLRVVPPGAGICHQVNLEHLGQVVSTRDGVASTRSSAPTRTPR